MFQLNIQNFRSFKNIDFDFSRINILIGPNNSGKSTLLKFFLMLKQSINEPESPLTVKGKLVDLGQFEDVIYRGREKKEFGFTFGTKKHYIRTLIPYMSNTNGSFEASCKEFELEKIPIKLDVKFNSSENNKIHSNNIISHKLMGKLEGQNKQIIQDKLQIIHTVDISFFNLQRQFTLKGNILNNVSFLDIYNTNSIRLTPENTLKFIFLNSLGLYITNIINDFHYINPLDALPKRVFEKNGISNHLEIIVNWLASGNDEDMRNERLTRLTILFQQMGIAEEVKLEVYPNSIEVLIKTEKKGFWINLADVGLGISLQIPTLLEAFAGEESKNGKFLLLEQPEIHIHPKLHENFIETLVGMGEKNTYFIETHSPFIVQKLQLMVKEGQLKPEDVAIYYFEKEGNETTATRYNIEEDGFMDKSLPESFIGNSYNLAMKLLK